MHHTVSAFRTAFFGSGCASQFKDSGSIGFADSGSTVDRFVGTVAVAFRGVAEMGGFGRLGSHAGGDRILRVLVEID